MASNKIQNLTQLDNGETLRMFSMRNRFRFQVMVDNYLKSDPIWRAVAIVMINLVAFRQKSSLTKEIEYCCIFPLIYRVIYYYMNSSCCSNHRFLHNWTPEKSIFKFLYILCLPELVGFFIIKDTRVALLLSPALLIKRKETIERMKFQGERSCLE